MSTHAPGIFQRSETRSPCLSRLAAKKKDDDTRPLLGTIMKDNFMAVKYEFDDMQKAFMTQQVPTSRLLSLFVRYIFFSHSALCTQHDFALLSQLSQEMMVLSLHPAARRLDAEGVLV